MLSFEIRDAQELTMFLRDIRFSKGADAAK